MLQSVVKCCISEPELPLCFNLNNIDSINFQEKTNKLLIDLTIVTSVLLWEITHLIKMPSWKNEYFNYDSFITQIDNVNLEPLMNRLLNEFSRIILEDDKIVITSQQTVLFYKVFNLIYLIISDSPNKHLRKYLRLNFQEEFKYYFCEDKMRLKCFNYYSITKDLLKTIEKLEKLIL